MNLSYHFLAILSDSLTPINVQLTIYGLEHGWNVNNIEVLMGFSVAFVTNM